MGVFANVRIRCFCAARTVDSISRSPIPAMSQTAAPSREDVSGVLNIGRYCLQSFSRPVLSIPARSHSTAVMERCTRWVYTRFKSSAEYRASKVPAVHAASWSL